MAVIGENIENDPENAINMKIVDGKENKWNLINLKGNENLEIDYSANIRNNEEESSEEAEINF